MDREPILIVGAGPTGLTAAIALSILGIPCRIIDKLEEPTQQSRAAGIHARTLEILHALGVIDRFLEIGIQANILSFFDEKKLISQLDYSKIQSTYPFILLLPQAKTEYLLTEALHALGVKVERGCELIDFKQDNLGVRVQLKYKNGKESKFYTPFLLGADGAHSFVRSKLNFEFSGITLKESWILADVDVDWPIKDQIQLYNDKFGLFMLFPLGVNRFRMGSNHRIPGVNSDELPSLSEFALLAEQNLPRPVSISDAHWLTSFKISYRRVRTYQQDRVFLLGDAAHIHSPAGGQGMNTGMQDAFNLAWKLKTVLLSKTQGSLLLKTYTLERGAVSKQVIRDTKRLTRMMTLKNPLFKGMRNKLISFVSHNRIQNNIVQKLAEIRIKYPKSIIVGNQAGARMPDAHFKYFEQEKVITLLDIQKDLNHHIFVYSRDEKNLQALHRLIDSLGQNPFDCLKKILLGSPSLIKHFEKRSGWMIFEIISSSYPFDEGIYLLRPDGYIAWYSEAFTENAAETIHTYIETLRA